MVQCTAGLGCWPPCKSCMVAAVFFTKRNHFSYDFAVSRWPADLLLTDEVVLLPPAIGPTLGASFVLWALCHHLAEGWLLMHWAYGGGQRQKHKFDVEWNIYFLDLGMVLEDSQISALKKALQQ